MKTAPAGALLFAATAVLNVRGMLLEAAARCAAQLVAERGFTRRGELGDRELGPPELLTSNFLAC